MVVKEIKYIDTKPTPSYQSLERYGLKTHKEEILGSVEKAKTKLAGLPEVVKGQLRQMGLDLENPYVLYYSSTNYNEPRHSDINYLPPVIVAPDLSEAVAVPHYNYSGYMRGPQSAQLVEALHDIKPVKEGNVPTVLLFLDTDDFNKTGSKEGTYHGGHSNGEDGNQTIAQFHARDLIDEVDGLGLGVIHGEAKLQKVISVSEIASVYKLRKHLRSDEFLANVLILESQFAKRQRKPLAS
ncbi:MAG TPA: hypothetical protein VF189_03685 [Patescibacteria group bacterium]